MENTLDGRSSPRKTTNPNDLKQAKKNKSKRKKGKRSREDCDAKGDCSGDDLWLAGSHVEGKTDPQVPHSEISVSMLSRSSQQMPKPLKLTSGASATTLPKNKLKSSSSSDIKIAKCNTNSKTSMSAYQSSGQKLPLNDTCRWDFALSDEEAEEKRIELYKVNRQKRYLAATNINYNDWRKNLA